MWRGFQKDFRKCLIEVRKMSKDEMEDQKWIYCPICGNKTRVRLRKDTVLLHFPLFCPKCKESRLMQRFANQAD